MKKSSGKTLVGTALLLLLFSAGPRAVAEEKVTLPGVSGEIEMVIHVPPGFQDSQQYSVLVSPGDYYWKDRPFQPGWIVVWSDAFYGKDRIKDSKKAIEWLRRRYRIRGGGLHMAGWSANSAGVFDIVMAYPEDFLSVTGIAGMPGSGAENRLHLLEDIRVQFIVGEKDQYWRQGSERWHKLMKKAGIDTSLEIVPKGEHVMPEIANEPIFERLNRIVEARATKADSATQR